WERKSECSCQAKPTSTQPSSSSSSNLKSAPSTSSASSANTSAAKGKKPFHSNSSTTSSSDPSTPDLSGILGKDSKLTTAECLCHIKNMLCLFCGLPGHTAKDCPRSASKAAKACAVQAEPSSAPAPSGKTVFS